MSNIGHIIVCDEVFNSPNGEVIIKQPLNMIFTPILPTHYSFVIAIGLINLKPTVRYIAVVKVTSPSGKLLLKNDIEFDIGNEDTAEFTAAGGYNINCRNVLLDEFGDYIISVEIDKERNQLILPVVKKED
ncbi:DUF6941 family protein [Planococcus shenhongbingii]|uniref:Exosporium protein C n=1 Tax=Planococcus shenhongbingii TaxID=3058398 RepID=A0ABT8N8I6_9BACL|nr:hypothetical protein [Planococcus sp. N017]MDN7243967.1 hypothetical protein [Planococcus sp. N017]